FSELVREARDAGYAEPDPREDLSGEDVRRKLLILARAAGFPLEAHQVAVEPLLPAALRDAARDEADALLPLLDAPLRGRLEAARRDGARLCFVGRFDPEGGSSVGLQVLGPAHPLCAGTGTDNRVAIWSDRYARQPLVIQGPGAGAEVTAAALLDDVLRIVRAGPAGVCPRPAVRPGAACRASGWSARQSHARGPSPFPSTGGGAPSPGVLSPTSACRGGGRARRVERQSGQRENGAAPRRVSTR